MKELFEYSAEVEAAFAKKQPVLALESTLITHGLPQPINLETAIELENIARQEGVTPATIAILNGKIKIGLSSTELEQLAQNTTTIKASCRDIAYALAHKLSAGTTVAATMFCAQKAGIKVFATGGIGGVHRGEELDISADLTELARSPMAVVCAGAKAILDLPRTLEFLETHSIPVIGYKTDMFPAFYTSKTNFPLHSFANDVDTLANLLKIHWQLGMTSGAVVANPIPTQYEISAEMINPVIECALIRAQEKQITGKSITPFLLNEVSQATLGKSLSANIHLIKNNVQLGARLACKLNL